MDQAGRGDIVDLAGDAAGVVMNQVLGLGLEEFGVSTGQGHAVIDISAGLFLGERMQSNVHVYAMGQIGM